MGVIVDTNILVAGERRKYSAYEVFAQLREAHGSVAIGLSAVTLVELARGVERAKLEAQRAARQSFLNDLIVGVKVYPFTLEIAQLAGKISGQQSLRGLVIPFEDLLIGATALHLGFAISPETSATRSDPRLDCEERIVHAHSIWAGAASGSSPSSRTLDAPAIMNADGFYLLAQASCRRFASSPI